MSCVNTGEYSTDIGEYTDCAKRIESRNFSYPVLQIVKLAKFGLVYLANTG